MNINKLLLLIAIVCFALAAICQIGSTSILSLGVVDLLVLGVPFYAASKYPFKG